ncbi:hypothetical protein CHS0354_018287 [Potamilus streckersoni]|uniref:Uncharacterized protein n=1 Tax=Potamilus streckersoni TaxID=2493646 RepID=A0AAE0WET9_9BIVA|nr:hypothetical protein CHS0354_018287 [Potamilus streckersoni]
MIYVLHHDEPNDFLQVDENLTDNQRPMQVDENLTDNQRPMQVDENLTDNQRPIRLVDVPENDGESVSKRIIARNLALAQRLPIFICQVNELCKVYMT